MKNTKLYDTLGIASHASTQDVKRAYQQLAMQCHPDKGGDPEKFKAVSAAYDVLKDPERRKIYDKLGMKGLEAMGDDANPMALKLLAASELICCFATTVYALWLMFFIFISLKVDGKVDWSWSVALVPMWIFQSVLTLGALMGVVSAVQEGECTGGKKMLARALEVWSVVAWLIFLILLTQKLDGHSDMSWVVVFLPILINRAVSAVSQLRRLSKSAYDALPVRVAPYPIWCAQCIFAWAAVTVFYLLLMFQWEGTIDAGYVVVFLPLGLLLLLRILTEMYAAYSDARAQDGGAAGALCTAFCASMPLLIVMAQLVLLVCKFNGADIDMAVVFIPTWIISALLGCFGCCFIFAVSNDFEDGDDDDATKPLAQQEHGPGDADESKADGAGAQPAPPAAAPQQAVADTEDID